jgi:hypothetical protein
MWGHASTFRQLPLQSLVLGLRKPLRLGGAHPYVHGTAHVPGKFIGRDSVLSMLEPGEAVVNRGAMQQPGMRAKIAYLNRLGIQGHEQGTPNVAPGSLGNNQPLDPFGPPAIHGSPGLGTSGGFMTPGAGMSHGSDIWPTGGQGVGRPPGSIIPNGGFGLNLSDENAGVTPPAPTHAAPWGTQGWPAWLQGQFAAHPALTPPANWTPPANPPVFPNRG